MSEIDFNSVYDGVTLALRAAFPDSNIYGGSTDQNVDPGDLNVIMPSAGHIREVGTRHRRTPILDVIYYSSGDPSECYDMAHKLAVVLQSITTPEGDTLNCTSCDWTVDDDVLHVQVGYDHFIYTPTDPDYMGALQIEQEG